MESGPESVQGDFVSNATLPRGRCDSAGVINQSH